MEEENNKQDVVVEARLRGPGPARYKLPSTVGRENVDCTKHYAPSYSFGQKTWKMYSDSPGPVYNFDSKMTNRGSAEAPLYSLSGRHKDSKMFVTPGPGQYNTERIVPPMERRAPSFTMSTRTRYRSADNVPAPNRYSLPCTLGDKVPHVKGGMAVTMSGRHEIYSSSYDFARTPGPAGYPAICANVTKSKRPVFTLKPRTDMPKSKMNNPGPGAYDPDKQKRSNYKFTMGTRHSEFIMPMITMTDVQD